MSLSMNKTFKQQLLCKVVPNLNKADFWGEFPTYYRKTEGYIEIITFVKDKYQCAYTITASAVNLNKDSQHNNINYNIYCSDIDKITAHQCKRFYTLTKSCNNEQFRYGDIYLALGMGIVSISPQSKRPLGILLTKQSDKQWDKLCNTINKRLHKIYQWLNKLKQAL